MPLIKCKKWVAKYIPDIERYWRRQKLIRAFGRESKPTVEGNILVASHERSGTHLALNTIFLNTNVYRYYCDDADYQKCWFSKSMVHKTHKFPFDLDLDHYDRIIYMIRQPRDVMSSFQKHLQHPEFAHPSGSGQALAGSLSAFSESIVPDYLWGTGNAARNFSGQTFLERWISHVEAWSGAHNQQPQKITILPYELLREHPEMLLSAITKVPGIIVKSNLCPDLEKHPSIQPGRGAVTQEHLIKSSSLPGTWQQATRTYDRLLAAIDIR